MAIDRRLDGYAFEDLEEGISAVISKTVTEADIVLTRLEVDLRRLLDALVMMEERVVTVD